MALPVWQKGYKKEINHRLRFKTVLYGEHSEGVFLKIATSGIYNLFINETFVACGPARAGKNHFRLDEYDITRFLGQSVSVIVIEVCGYNTNAFNIQNQESFVQIEIAENGQPIKWTGGFHFQAQINPYYYKKTQRYSFQRPMSEAYHYKNPDDFFRVDYVENAVEMECLEEKNIISRYAPYPMYEREMALPISKGNIGIVNPECYKSDRAWNNIGEQLIGFKISELDVFPTQECQDFEFVDLELINSKQEMVLTEKQFAMYSFPRLCCGLLNAKIKCNAKTRIYILFDEILSDNSVNFLRLECANAIRYDLDVGEHDLHLFESYTIKYVQFCVLFGDCRVENIEIIENKHPSVEFQFDSVDEEMQLIVDAAIETYRHNAIDIFMDCPSRERAGWLCDSYFTARVERVLTGNNLIEKSFLENFLHEDSYDYLPDGIFPMCYPADHYDGNFIPNWNFWLVLELKDYLLRSSDKVLIENYRSKIEKLFDYFLKFENRDGLLEDLEGWVFVEWSKANDFVQNINYPTNMMYYAALKAAGELYDNEVWICRAQNIKQKILEQSFDGEFFTDHAIRTDDTLMNPGDITEVTQYYAFFCEIATPETHNELFDKMISDFGPGRKTNNIWPNVHFAAPFIGYYLRLEIMMRYGFHQDVYENIKGYFLNMAEQTGTLWEKADPFASCDHGFASYILYWLSQMNRM